MWKLHKRIVCIEKKNAPKSEFNLNIFVIYLFNDKLHFSGYMLPRRVADLGVLESEDEEDNSKDDNT